MNITAKLRLIREVGEEIVTGDELNALLETKQHPVAYDGFEPSGTDVHIAQGLLRAININKMTQAGCSFKMLVADWHAWANNKMGGQLERIQTVGAYMVELWRACDMDLDSVSFVYASSLVKEDDYWKKVLEVSRNTTVKRIIRTGQIMGRKDADVQQASQILYPCMQAADIFQLGADITQLGMDQRKVNVLARELGPKLGYGKPVIVSHHMLMGLGEPKAGITDATERAIEVKMSKSRPETAIFMNDSEDAVTRKLAKAYCPPKQVTENPVLEYCRYIIFERLSEMEIQRPAKFGGDITVHTYAELEALYRSGALHPMDLKKAVAEAMNVLLEPVRRRLSKNRKAQELMQDIATYRVTR